MNNKLIIFILLILGNFNLYSQEDFTIVKTDNSEYPKIKVFIQTENENVKKEDFKILEENAEVNFNFDTLPYSGFVQEKLIFFMTELINNEDSAILYYTGIRESLKNLQTNDLINLGFFLNSDTVNYFSGYSSAEFSSDFNYFSEILKNKHKQNIIFSESKTICDNMLSLLDFIKNKEIQKENKALIIIFNNINYKNNNEECINMIKEFNIPVYFVTTSQIDTANENKLINISRITGGIYTLTKINKISDILIKYFEDISLRNNLAQKNIYLISFETSQTNNKNFFKIKYNKQEKKEFFENITEDTIIKNYKIYILILLTLFSVLLVWHIIFRWKHKMSKTIKFSTEEDKKNTDIELNNSYDNIAKPAVIVLKTKDEIKNIKVGAVGCVVGRNAECEITIKDETVSAFHAEIKIKNGRYFITDLDSTNGTFVNGYRINESELKSHDLIKVGTALLKIKY